MKSIPLRYSNKGAAPKKTNKLAPKTGAEKGPRKATNHEKNHENEAAAFRLIVKAMKAVAELYSQDLTRPGFVLSDLQAPSEGRWYASIVRYDGRGPQQEKRVLSQARAASAEEAVRICVADWMTSTKAARELYMEVNR